MWYLKCILRSEPFFDSSSLSVCLSPSVCKFVSIEMKSAFDETGKTKEVIDRNYGFIDNKGAPPIKYVKSWVCLYVFGGEGSRLRQRCNPRPCCGRPSCSSWSQLSLSVGGLFWIEMGSCCSTQTHTHTEALIISQQSSELISVMSKFWQLLISQCCCLQFVLFAVHAHRSRCNQVYCPPVLMASTQKSLDHFKNLRMWKWASFSVCRDLRFIEVIENVCQRLLEYNLHKERAGSNRFAKVRLCVWFKVGFLVLKWAWLC